MGPFPADPARKTVPATVGAGFDASPAAKSCVNLFLKDRVILSAPSRSIVK